MNCASGFATVTHGGVQRQRENMRLAWVKSDQTLRARAAYDLGYRSGLLDDVTNGLLDDKLVVLRGAGRNGKSVLLKDTAARLCGRGDVDPRQLVYVPTDGMRASDLGRVAKLGRELTRSVGEARRVWLLDEVTGLRGWTQALKYLRDNTELGADTVVCTGSSWDREAEVERDLLAGRAGTCRLKRVRILHPMSFRDVLAAAGREIPLPASALRRGRSRTRPPGSSRRRSSSSWMSSTSPGRRTLPRAAFRGRSRSTTRPARSARRSCGTWRRGCIEMSTRRRGRTRCRSSCPRSMVAAPRR